MDTGNGILELMRAENEKEAAEKKAQMEAKQEPSLIYIVSDGKEEAGDE